MTSGLDREQTPRIDRTANRVNIASRYLGSTVLGRTARNLLLRRAGAQIAGSAAIRGGTYFTCPQNLHAETGAMVGEGVYFDLAGPITLGERCGLAHGSRVLTTVYEIGPSDCRARPVGSAPVVIGAGVWVGANCTVLPGVTIGDGSVVGACSLVASDVPAGVLAAGNPCRIIRELGGPPKGSEPESMVQRG